MDGVPTPTRTAPPGSILSTMVSHKIAFQQRVLLLKKENVGKTLAWILSEGLFNFKKQGLVICFTP